MTINSRIRELRMERSVSVKDLAIAIGLTPQAICNYEAGDREPSIAIIIKLCDFFEVSADYLIGRSDNY